MDPILQQLRENDPVTLSFKDIAETYDKLKEDYKRLAIGAKDVTAVVFWKAKQVS